MLAPRCEARCEPPAVKLATQARLRWGWRWTCCGGVPCCLQRLLGALSPAGLIQAWQTPGGRCWGAEAVKTSRQNIKYQRPHSCPCLWHDNCTNKCTNCKKSSCNYVHCIIPKALELQDYALLPCMHADHTHRPIIPCQLWSWRVQSGWLQAPAAPASVSPAHWHARWAVPTCQCQLGLLGPHLMLLSWHSAMAPLVWP